MQLQFGGEVMWESCAEVRIVSKATEKKRESITLTRGCGTSNFRDLQSWARRKAMLTCIPSINRL